MLELQNRDFNGLCFINLVDFDMLYGHRNDATGYANAMMEFDAALGEFITNMDQDDLLIITADHGFLYTYSPLTEDDKVSKSSWSGKNVEYGRRYCIMEKDATPDFLQPVLFLDGNTDYSAFAPKENVRIKMSGGGLNFVHGGISLQEMVVPVIDYHFLRNDSKTYQKNKAKFDTKPVTVSLISANHKISNMIFSLNFYQKEAVGDNREKAIYSLYFTDSSRYSFTLKEAL